ncbi:MAG TPA: DUF4437 domain-containing protein [Sphingomicrobium sp.]|nr:DUF4437 domain-containing protein [Sphingomicrobium sp.]
MRNAPTDAETGANATAEAAAAGGNAAAGAPAAGPATPGESEKPLAIAAASADLKWGDCPAGMPEGCQAAVLHGDPAKPNADILLKVPAGSAIAPHWHSSAERMMLVTGQLAVKYQGAAEANLLPGTYAYGPAQLPHQASCRSSEPCTLFIAFEDPVDRHPFEGEL